jgi:hypothetical protein
MDLYDRLEDDAQLFGSDGIHVNEDGAEVVAGILRHYVEQQP